MFCSKHITNSNPHEVLQPASVGAVCVLLGVCKQKQGYSVVCNATNTPRENTDSSPAWLRKPFTVAGLSPPPQSTARLYDFSKEPGCTEPFADWCVCHHTHTINNTPSHSHTPVFHDGFWKGAPKLANEWPSSLQVWPFSKGSYLYQGGRRSKAESWGPDPTGKDEGH